MAHRSQNLALDASEENSPLRKDFTACEKTSQLQDLVRNIIQLSGFSKGEIAEALGVTPSTVSMWMDRTANGRRVSQQHADKLLRLVKRRPLMLMQSVDALEDALADMVNRYFPHGKGDF